MATKTLLSVEELELTRESFIPVDQMEFALDRLNDILQRTIIYNPKEIADTIDYEIYELKKLLRKTIR